MINTFKLLGNAVVMQAASDYRVALVNQHVYELEDEEEYNKWTNKVDELERFFAGDGIKSYTMLNGTMLMNRLKREVILHNYDLKAIRKSHLLAKESP